MSTASPALSRREREVPALVAEGLSNREIASVCLARWRAGHSLGNGVAPKARGAGRNAKRFFLLGRRLFE
jgi:hypothetical protein